MALENDEILMTVDDVAKLLELRPFTVRCWVRAKRHGIPAIVIDRVIRFDRTAIKIWLKKFGR